MSENDLVDERSAHRWHLVGIMGVLGYSEEDADKFPHDAKAEQICEYISQLIKNGKQLREDLTAERAAREADKEKAIEAVSATAKMGLRIHDLEAKRRQQELRHEEYSVKASMREERRAGYHHEVFAHLRAENRELADINDRLAAVLGVYALRLEEAEGTEVSGE